MPLFFFNDTATTEIYTLSLHDALPIYEWCLHLDPDRSAGPKHQFHDHPRHGQWLDRKSTRLNSSHANISYAVFCLKKKTSRALSGLTAPSPVARSNTPSPCRSLVLAAL